MYKILKEKINRDITKIIGKYNLPSFRVVETFHNINKKNAEWEINMIQFRLTHQDCYDIDGFYYDNLKNTKISKNHMKYDFGSKYSYFWTITKIK